MRTKPAPDCFILLLTAIAIALGAFSARAQAPIISSIGQNGRLVCTNLVPGSTAVVEWASSPTGPWTNNWAGLEAVTVDTNGAIQVSVPMFYRVRGTPPPAGMALVPAGMVVMGDWNGNPNETPNQVADVSAFYIDQTEVTKALWEDVYQWATNHGYAFDQAGAGKAPNHPVYDITWYDAVKWCNARSEKEGRTSAYYLETGQTSVYRSGQIDLQNSWVKWDRGQL